MVEVWGKMQVKFGGKLSACDWGGRKTVLHGYSPEYKLLFHINYAPDGHIQNVSLYKDIKHIVIIKDKMDPF